MQLKIENSELPVGLSKTEIIKICANLWATLHLTLASAQPSPLGGVGGGFLVPFPAAKLHQSPCNLVANI